MRAVEPLRLQQGAVTSLGAGQVQSCGLGGTGGTVNDFGAVNDMCR